MTAAPITPSPQDDFAPLSESRTKGGHRAIVTTHEDVVDLNTSLRESEERYRTLFDLSPVAVYSIDVEGVIEKFNVHAAELWGRSPKPGDTDERFCGSHRLFLPDGTILPHDQTPMAAVVRGEIAEARNVEVVIERPDASRVTVIANIVPLKNDRGEVVGAINCFYDITERSRLERQTRDQAQTLTELHRRKDDFLAMLSHELRNPLAPIANALQLLRLRASADPKQRKVLGVIERQVTQLVRIIEDLMEISRIGSGKIHLRRERILLSEVVDRAVETTAPLIVQRRQELLVSLPPQPILLHADLTRMIQVLVNLLTNAAKYTEERGKIWLTVERHGDNVVLTVRDSGIGISPELLPHVFGMFTQADRSLDRAQGGLGIGLSLVKALVELHDGTINVTSALGTGSEFVWRMPPMPASSSEAPSIAPARHVEPTSERRVLIVDDNVDAAQILGMLLEEAGHEVLLVHDGLSAVEAALSYLPDIMLVDIGLPGLNGFEVARAIREQPRLQHMVLVAVTGYGLESDREHSLDAGFNHHLVKPTDLDDVAKIIAAATRLAGGGEAEVAPSAP